jgi:hypothetical protein
MTGRQPGGGLRPAARQPRTVGIARAIGVGLAGAVLLATVATLVTANVLNRSSEVNALNDRVAQQSGELEGLRAEVAAAGDMQTRVTQLEAEMAALDGEKVELAAEVEARDQQVSALQADKTALEDQLSRILNPEVTWPDVEYGMALRGCVGCFSGDKYLLVLDVTVTNDTSNTAWFSTADFKLKGPDGTVYPIIDQSPVAYTRDSLPRGRIEIMSQELQPGEQVRGSLVFYVGRNGVTQFTITYHEISESISLPA